MKEASTLVSGWAWLPSDILDLILEKLVQISDLIRFGAVCNHWHSVTLHQKQQHLKSCHKQLPMLMIPTKDGRNERCALYSVTQGKTYSFELHVPYRKRFCGSSHGWLACVDENLVVTLLNPFTAHAISLPPVPRFTTSRSRAAYYRCDYYINKVVLSADPSLFPNDYEVVVIYDGYGKQIAHIKSGDDAWTIIDQVIGFDDVIYYKGQFLAVSLNGSVFSINVSSDQTIKPHVSIVVPMTPGTDNKAYLVQSSMCVSALDFLGCQPDSIYFTDDCVDVECHKPKGPHDIGVFNLENRSMGTHYCLDRSQKHMPPAIWILPTMV